MKFEEAGISSGVACNADGAFQAGMGMACGDLDGDRLPDLVVTNFYGESTTFFRNLGAGHLHRPDRRDRPGRAQPVPARLRHRPPRRQQRRPARPGHGQRPRQRRSPRLSLRDAGSAPDGRQGRPPDRRDSIGGRALDRPARRPRPGRRRPRQRRPRRPGVACRRTRPSSSSTTRPTAATS